MKRAWKVLESVWVAWVVTFLAAYYLAGPWREVSNDSVEYESTAQHMSAGEGFLSDLKLYLCTPGPVVHSAIGERQPAFPAVMAAALWLWPGSPSGPVAEWAVTELLAGRMPQWNEKNLCYD